MSAPLVRLSSWPRLVSGKISTHEGLDEGDAKSRERADNMKSAGHLPSSPSEGEHGKRALQDYRCSIARDHVGATRSHGRQFLTPNMCEQVLVACSEAEREDSFEGRHVDALCEWNLTDKNG